ncbi:MAG: bile acid:sodium symporter family protein [Spirochaetaceae bacterium]|jgi:tagaturonate reductase|nr:bile acid:sodium symporter family protein [Spirochaetaceae bacterium]
MQIHNPHEKPVYRFFDRMNKALDKAMAIIPPAGVLMGFLFSRHIAPLKPLVTWLFAYITLVGALGLTLTDFRKALGKIHIIALILLCAHVVNPLLTAFLAQLCFPSRPDVVSGYVLLMSIPIAVSCYIWSSIFGGIDAIVLTVILIDSVIAPVVTPATVRLLAHTAVVLDTRGMILSIAYSVAIPMVMGVVANQGSRNRAKIFVVPIAKPFSKVFLVLMVSINSAQAASRITLSPAVLPIVLMSVCVCFLGFMMGYVISRVFLKADRAMQVTMTYTCGMRNISASLVLVIKFFPPESSIPVITGILLQQGIAALSGYLLFRRTAPTVNACPDPVRRFR